MKKLSLTLISLIFSMTVLASQSFAGGAKHEKREVLVFGPQGQRIIYEYYRVNTSNLPPGLAKRGGALPPGLEKQLRRNGHLPPGLEGRIEPFPIELERQLPAIPAVYRRGTIGDRAVIYDPTTRAILDIIQIITGRR